MSEADVERLRVHRLWMEVHEKLLGYLGVCPGSEAALALLAAANLLIERAFEFGMGTLQAHAVEQRGGQVSLAEARVVARQVLEQAEAERKPAEDGKLAENIVKLMAKAGTQCDGLRAGWSAPEIGHGLSVVMPGVSIEAIEEALGILMGDGVVIDFNKGKSCISLYCLADNYIEVFGNASPEPKPDERGALSHGLEVTLKSNRDASGNLRTWSLNSLFYALRDEHPWITKADVEAATMAEWCEEAAPGVYRWVDVPSATAQVVETPAVEPEQKPKAGVVEAADAIYGVLKVEAAGGQRRIWKEYDIIGLLGRGAELGVRLRDEYLSQEMLTAVISFLVAEGKLEPVPLSPERPWIKQPGWRVV